ncbi:hypothetical protein [Paenibacillus sp. KN14-4R]|uniref:hypothetical protein n=1 Tax=Paenibacillus sp. KN14-4R TaxID=3445773 RepID=UPI003FA164EF
MIRLLLYKAPEFKFSNDEILEYERMFNDAFSQNGLIDHRCHYPKSRFIQYISTTKNVILHGSNKKDIEAFEPRRQTLFNGELTEAIFASRDGLWPVFYAVLDRKKVAKNFRNGSVSTRSSRGKYHFYSIDQYTAPKNPWTSGMIYFLPLDTFIKTSHGAIEFDEWISKVPVKPMIKIEVDPRDFYFIDKVSVHHDKESIVRTWLLYKLRIKYQKSKKG